VGPDGGGKLGRNVEPFGCRTTGRFSSTHPLDNRFRNGNPWNFVGHELRVPEALEWDDRREHWNATVAALQELDQRRDVEHGLCNSELSSRLYFLTEATMLVLEVER
jgi:hypothetical protein